MFGIRGRKGRDGLRHEGPGECPDLAEYLDRNRLRCSSGDGGILDVGRRWHRGGRVRCRQCGKEWDCQMEVTYGCSIRIGDTVHGERQWTVMELDMVGVRK